jgi:CheY-like chemotaxis protein
MRGVKPVLLLEDDNVDAMTVKRALKDLNVANPLVRAVNGEEALGYLQNDANVKPCVILLDLNMPKMNGVEFLKIVKADNRLKCIPIVVLTTSRADQDKLECFDRSVAGYIVKPVDYQGFLEAVRILNLYWTLSELPGCTLEAVCAAPG